MKFIERIRRWKNREVKLRLATVTSTYEKDYVSQMGREEKEGKDHFKKGKGEEVDEHAGK